MNSYLRRDFFQVDGYTSFFDARLFDFFLETQSLAGIGGSMAEIGVHHGRSFFLLAQARRGDEQALAVDVFEDDALYRDPQGFGRGVRFKQNCQRLGLALGDAEIYAGLSTTLDAAEIKRRVGPVRFFSVDGGHRYDDVAYDMRLAAQALHPRGIIVADDYMNAQWPEVSLAIADWLRENNNPLCPFLSSTSKLYLCHRDEKSFYRAHAKQFLASGRHQVRDTDLFADSYFFSRQSLAEKLHYFVKERVVNRLPRRGAAVPA
ncbi:MAG: class I SAM-dependent methyltransferase [Stellaceae bacterium]